MARRQSSCGRQQQRHHLLGGGFGRRWRGIAAVVAIGGCVASVALLANAALPVAVKECAYSENFTAARPCTADLYMGQHMTFECEEAATTEPASAQATGKYCSTALTESGTCSSPQTLDADIGTSSLDQAKAKVILRLKEEYSSKFANVISYNLRCVNGDKKMFVTAKLWPFTAPLTAKPRQSCVNDQDGGTTADIRCNYYGFKSDAASVDCRESGETGTFVPGDAHTNSTGKVCTTGFKSQAEPACLGDTTDSWANVAAGATVSGSNTNQTLSVDLSSLTPARSVVYIGCNRSGGKTMFTKGMLLKEDFVAIDSKYVPMIKHVCTPQNGRAVNSPCQAALAADEAAVVVCASFVGKSNYKLMPADVNKADGSFCKAMPSSFNGDCTDTLKWKDGAQAEVMMDATMDFFIVAMPSANLNNLKEQVTAYGYCSDQTDGVAFRFSMGTAPTTTRRPDNGSAATQMTFGGAVMGLVTFLSAAVAAVAVL